MNAVAPPPRPRPPLPPPGLAPVPPLLRVVLPLVITAIVLGVVFARFFPGAGATRPAPVARFTNVTAESGLRFVHQQGGAEAPTTLGGAVVVLDYDRDGHPDLFFVNGAPWPWAESLAKRVSLGGCALFHNDGTGHFTNVSAAAGLNVELQGMAAAAGDYDNDGFPDIFVTCVGANHLFHNRGNGTFEDVTEQAGVGGEDNSWSTGATWIDYDGDGRLDLVVLHYARWPHEVELSLAFTIADLGRSYGAPTGFLSAFPSVYRNLGGGRFALVPGSAGLRDVDPSTGLPVAKPLAVVPLDANGDGRLDLLISYHTAENALFLNRGDGTFQKWTAGRDDRHEGTAAGLATASLFPAAQAGGPDGRFAAFQAAGALDPHGPDDLQLHLAGKLAVEPFDYHLDGRLEIFSGRGRAEPNLNKFEAGRDFAGAPQVFWNNGGNWLAVPEKAGETQPPLPSLTARGIAVADFDGDGDSDVVIAQNNGSPVLLRNDQRLGLPWLRLHLTATRSHPEAGGARVEVHTPRRVLVQTVAPAMGFMAQSESVLTFGLGEDARVRRIVIRWPSGQTQELKPDALNRTLEIREP